MEGRWKGRGASTELCELLGALLSSLGDLLGAESFIRRAPKSCREERRGGGGRLEMVSFDYEIYERALSPIREAPFCDFITYSVEMKI